MSRPTSWPQRAQAPYPVKTTTQIPIDHSTQRGRTTSCSMPRMSPTPARAAALVAALLFGAAVPALAAKRSGERYYLQVTGAEVAPSLPATLGPKAQAALVKLVAARKEFVTTLEGAPADPAALTAWLKKKKLKAYKVVVKVVDYKLSVAPKEEGKASQVVKVTTQVDLLASAIPDNAMAITGSGGATIGSEVGAKVRPRDEELATSDSLDAALSAAIEDTVKKLQAPPPAKPAKK